MVQLPISPARYEILKQELVNAGVSLSMSDNDHGTLVTKDVTLACVYDGVGLLDVSITAKHSWEARFASNSMIESHIAEMFQKYIQQIP